MMEGEEAGYRMSEDIWPGGWEWIRGLKGRFMGMRGKIFE